nr:hypothetical protein CJLB15_00036 [Campylobacter phage CJLB-15]
MFTEITKVNITTLEQVLPLGSMYHQPNGLGFRLLYIPDLEIKEPDQHQIYFS